ncbi:MAG: T9SS type A sorting domain-containing protein, partial [Bacteroidales bacterium]
MDGLSNTEPDALQLDVEIPDTACHNDTIPVQVHIAGKSAPYTLSFSTGQVIDSIYYPPTFVPQEIGLGVLEIIWDGSPVILTDTINAATITNHEWGHCIVKDVDFHTPAATGDHNIQITLTDAYGETTTITRSLHVEYCPDNVVQENENPALRLYPNPATNKLHLQIPNLTQPQHAEIYDASGKLVFTKSISTKTTTLDISNLKPGNYILKINGISKGFTVVR